MAAPNTVSEEKPEVTFVGDVGRDQFQNDEFYKPAALVGDGLVKSPLDELPILKVSWLFRRSIVYAFLAFTSSILDGFAVSTGDGFLPSCAAADRTGLHVWLHYQQ